MQISVVSESFKRGARLRYPLRDSRGILLLAQGAEVTDKLYNLLHLRGIALEVQGCLRVVSGGPQGQEIPLRKGQMTVGRHPECEVQIASQVVSGFHCRIYKLPLDVLLEDLESRNGTYRNERRIMGRVELHDGDQIRVGNTVLGVELFAAVSANSNEGSQALHGWILADSKNGRPAEAPMAATAADIPLNIPAESGHERPGSS